MVTLTNYRADGTPFLNRLMIAPVMDGNGDVFAFVGLQAEVSERRSGADGAVSRFDDRLQEMQHRVKNHLQMVASMIRMQARESGDGDRAGFAVLARRVDALALLYDEFSMPPDKAGDGVRYDVVSAGAYVSRVANTVGALDGGRNIRVGVDVDSVYMRTDRAAQVGLLTSEILSNTFKHAFGGRTEGIVQIRLKQLGGDRVRLSVEDDGVGLGDSDWPKQGNLGARIVMGLVQQLDARIDVTSGEGGTRVTVDFRNALDTRLDDDGIRMLAEPVVLRPGDGAMDSGIGGGARDGALADPAEDAGHAG